MLNLAQPLDTSDELLMSDEERSAFMTPLYRVHHYRPVGPTGYRGVTKAGNIFLARIWSKGKAYYLGSFPTAEEAARAYDAKARELHKEFAMVNFPDEVAA